MLALKPLSFNISAHSLTLVPGPNGAGKSSLLRPLAGADFSEGNDVMVGGFSTWWFLTFAGLPYPLAILAGTVVTMLCGLVLWYAIVPPLWRRRSPP